MEVETHFGPTYTVAKITLENGEKCTTESGCMVAMSGNLRVETTTYKKGKGNLLKSLKRAFAGESFFLNHYEAYLPGELWVSSVHPGAVIVRELSGEKLLVQGGSFVACSENIEIETKWQGIKGLLSGEGLFWLELSGSGKVVLSTYGDIYEVDVEDEYIVDTGHIVAFEETLDFKISKAGSSWLHSFIGGEGLVCNFKGNGKIWCQSHNQNSFGMALRPLLKIKRR